LILNIN